MSKLKLSALLLLTLFSLSSCWNVNDKIENEVSSNTWTQVEVKKEENKVKEISDSDLDIRRTMTIYAIDENKKIISEFNIKHWKNQYFSDLERLYSELYHGEFPTLSNHFVNNFIFWEDKVLNYENYLKLKQKRRKI